ncbi:hypothetical protein [Shewanella cutis]|uniref:Transcriptional regulator n=1 Tax=Shewanella cutis TaxID=2766780 RepID=A0ABS9QW39_9GAMM|nr:hypothetical protein [Shewanella sp. PS-2]MCG9964588.1 transcriptional regulator [Shewanella sp. PS-2]
MISNSTQLKKVEPEQPNRFLVPANFQEAFQIAEMLSQSEMVPKNYQRKPNDIVIAMAMGAELGFQPLQSLQNIAVINGRPSVWGDAFRALIIGSPDLVEFKEWYENDTAHCLIKRRLASGAVVEFNGSFSLEDAKQAGLLGKQGPWTQYTKRMQQWRALGFAGRDAYADRLRGIWLDVEAQDLPPERDITPQPEKRADSRLNQVLSGAAVANEQAVMDHEPAQLPNLGEKLEWSLQDCTCMDELLEVGEAIKSAVGTGQISAEQRKSLGKLFTTKQRDFTAVNPETGEVS